MGALSDPGAYGVRVRAEAVPECSNAERAACDE